jgi:hypothetical protein
MKNFFVSLLFCGLMAMTLTAVSQGIVRDNAERQETDDQLSRCNHFTNERFQTVSRCIRNMPHSNTSESFGMLDFHGDHNDFLLLQTRWTHKTFGPAKSLKIARTSSFVSKHFHKIPKFHRNFCLIICTTLFFLTEEYLTEYTTYGIWLCFRIGILLFADFVFLASLRGIIQWYSRIMGLMYKNEESHLPITRILRYTTA